MPARMGQRTCWRDTERLDRELESPARVLAMAEALQAETGPAERDPFTADDR